MANSERNETSIGTNGQPLAKPLYYQRLESATRIDRLLDQIQDVYDKSTSSIDGAADLHFDGIPDGRETKTVNGIPTSRQERRSEKMGLFNFSKVKRNRRWLKNILMSDSSDSEEEVTELNIPDILAVHSLKNVAQREFGNDAELSRYQYYSASLLSNYDKYHEQQKLILGAKKKPKNKKKEKKKGKGKKSKLSRDMDESLLFEMSMDMDAFDEKGNPRSEFDDDYVSGKFGSKKKNSPNHEAIMNMKRKRLWVSLAKREISKAQKQKVANHKEVLTNAKRLAQACQRECRKSALGSQKVMKDIPSRARRLTKEMMLYWKRYEKVEKEHRKRAEKEAQEQLKMDIELREAKRQQRKLNFLITQTELYAHFMSRKMGIKDEMQEQILKQLDESTPEESTSGNVLLDVENDEYDAEGLKQQALRNAENAFNNQQAKTTAFDMDLSDKKREYNENLRLTNPFISIDEELPQPNLFVGKLKSYQLKGMNWLNSLYNKGINGILADEMGLGKTVQTIAMLVTLAEVQNIWGPFLVIAPASTLHNWQQEFAKFVPKFKVLPYWGNALDRKILRKFWNQKDLHTEHASFHVLITSYQLVVQDVKYFQRIKWQYMVLDEAQAIKSTSSVRWKILLAFNCRNRLLLTGTPIQNSMGELWALLHFIMPTLFDSHEEFNEWFSKDIESHAENRSAIDEKHLSRLHMILKPFMLRRIKKDVENELSDKIEILVYCMLSQRQKLLYQSLKNKISIEDLMQTSSSTPSQAQSVTSNLMNLVMQFRKVCNHPDLFERREIKSPWFVNLEPYQLPKLLYRNDISSDFSRHKLFLHLSVFHPEYIHHSLFPQYSSGIIRHQDCCFSFTRFINLSSAELEKLVTCGLLNRLFALFLVMKASFRIHHQSVWENNSSNKCNHHTLLLKPTQPSFHLCTYGSLVFASYHKPIHSFISDVYYRPHNHEIAIKREPGVPLFQDVTPSCNDLSYSPMYFPAILTKSCAKVVSQPINYYCYDRRAYVNNIFQKRMSCRKPLTQLFQEMGVLPPVHANQFPYFTSPTLFEPTMSSPYCCWSQIYVPDKDTLVTDSGKLEVLDGLLSKLKANGHRVLIYSQMTRMIDLLEEYMWHRKHTYIRLDGSSKISDRRDMVADFQARSDIFVFLLSTRAGGLGINLTAADTVIFYDSDWNPTVDQQAMDRAHRLGQTKQVTVYRLICKGSIEERILQRAQEKSEIQRMVISGGNFKPDTLKPKEVVSLLLDDEELEMKFKQRQEERRQEEGREKKRKREKLIVKKKEPIVKKKKRDSQMQSSFSINEAETLFLSDPLPPKSPASEKSSGAAVAAIHDDTSSEGPLVVDDGSPLGLTIPDTALDMESIMNAATGNKGTLGISGAKRSRGRGRPRGSGRGRGRGRTTTLATAAAELAAAHAGKSAAYAAYGYTLKDPGAVKVESPATSSVALPMHRSRSSLKTARNLLSLRGMGPAHKGQRLSSSTMTLASHIEPPTVSVQQKKKTPGMGFYMPGPSLS